MIMIATHLILLQIFVAAVFLIPCPRCIIGDCGLRVNPMSVRKELVYLSRGVIYGVCAYFPDNDLSF